MSSERPSVFLVEDDADTEALVLRALRRAGAGPVGVARDGLDACHQLEALAVGPSLILLDAKLPALDGFEVLRRIRHREVFRDTPVVMFSSEDSPKAIERALELGATEYAVKPTSYEALMTTVENIVGRYAPAAAAT